jgi:uncharacterized Zn-finger protein
MKCDKIIVLYFQVFNQVSLFLFQIEYGRIQDGSSSQWRTQPGTVSGIFQDNSTPGFPYDKKHFCKICKRNFSNLKLHMLTHTGEKPHACDFCGKRFTQKINLKHHRMIHTGEKPYVCSICGKGFNQQSSLRGHMMIHMKN